MHAQVTECILVTERQEQLETNTESDSSGDTSSVDEELEKY